MSEPQFLQTKVIVPPVRAALIPRPRLIECLSTSVPLVLLSASAGFGKTTLLSAWARATPVNVAWVTLNEQDNDPTRFWTYILLALRTCLGLSFGERAFALLGTTPLPPLSTMLTSLLNDLAKQEAEVALVLDDYYLLDEPAIHQSLGFWLTHAPTNLHLLLATRIDPPLALSRLRARAQLVELRDEDLRLSRQESATFLTHTMGLSLREAEILHVFQRTEGWLVGLQLVALSLRTHPDPATFLHAFNGSHRFLLDYIQDEILTHVPLATRNFLLRTSILTTLCADLCQQVAQEPESQVLLETLERANLFLVPLDTERHWYRYHPLFREALLAHLLANTSEDVSLLHQRASAWYAQEQRYEEAIPHALAAHDFVRAAELIEHFLVPQNWRNAYHTLHRWLRLLPQEILRSRPDLSFLTAQVIIMTQAAESSIWQGAQEYLRWALDGYRKAGNQAGCGRVLTQQAVLTAFQGDFPHAFALARHSFTLLPPEDRQWRGLCLCVLGTEVLLSGQLAHARSLFQQALALCSALGLLTGSQFAMLMLGEVCLATEDFPQATAFFRQVLDVSTEHPDLIRDQLIDEGGNRRTHFEGLAWYNLAYLAYLRNDLAEASHALQQGKGEGWFALLHILTPGLLLQVRLLYASGHVEQARALLLQLSTQESRLEVQREIRFCQAWLALQLGELADVQAWAEGLTGTGSPLAFVRREEESLLLVRLRLHENQPQVALDLLAPLLQEAQAQARLHSELQILVLVALAEAASGTLEQARMTLLQVVMSARSGDYSSLFLEEGPPMKTLLETLAPDVREQELASYVCRLLQAFGSADVHTQVLPEQKPSLLLEPLTPQEQRVLNLLGEGASNQEIANALVLSERTARKHVSNILSKLGAKKRTQAIAHARASGLL